MMNYRDDAEYLALNLRCQDMEVEIAEITARLDASYLSYLRGDPAPFDSRMERAAKIARRSKLRLDTKILGAEISGHKDRIRNKRHGDLLGELKDVLNENGLGHYVKIAFERASGLLQPQGESHEFQT